MTAKYAIRVNRQFYGPATRSELAQSMDYPAAITFDTSADAQEHIDHLESHPYRCAHNESGAPEYVIVRTDKLPKYLASEL